MKKIKYIYNLLKENYNKKEELYFKNLIENDYIKSCKYFYKKKTGKNLNLNNPVLFNEKIQYLKIYEILPNLSFYTKLADKYSVRKWITEKGLSNILNDVYDIYYNTENIPFDDLSEKYVLKLNNSSGFNYICKDKNTINKQKVIKFLNTGLNYKYFLAGGELQYRDIKPCIICEKFLCPKDGSELIDYKFFCYNGQVKYIDLWIDHNINNKPKYIYVDRNFQYVPVNEDTINFIKQKKKINIPSNINEMIKIAEILSENIPFVRCDLYSVDNKIYFGEMTFTPCAGVDPDYTIEGQKILGKYINL